MNTVSNPVDTVVEEFIQNCKAKQQMTSIMLCTVASCKAVQQTSWTEYTFGELLREEEDRQDGELEYMDLLFGKGSII